ncbi:TPA: hypothetical protein DF272_01600 [Candidatus Falkowbacteria bacterium]|nr:hypothetical protein [Candidatus Falkowbacteria bacterium]
MTDKLKNVCCRNISIIARYVKQMLGSDNLLFQGLSNPRDFLLDENNWITLAEYNQVMEKAIDLLKDPQAPYKMGLSSRRLESWGAFKYIVNIFASVILGPLEVYKQVGRYNKFFNKTKEISVVKEGKDHCYIKIKFAPDVSAVDDFYSDFFIQGILSSVPEIWNLPPAEFREAMLEYNLKSLLLSIGGLRNGEYEIKQQKVLIRGEECGRPVVLLPDVVGGHEIFLGRYRTLKASDDFASLPIGILITRDYPVNKMLKLRSGEIYNSPYFIYRVDWKKISFTKKLYYLFFQAHLSKRAYLEGIESQLQTIRNYVETLEDRVIERTEQLNRAKQEAEYWRGKADTLLRTMLPEKIVSRMMVGKLKAEKTRGTIVFTDLAGFTNFSRDMDPEDVNRVLTQYFTEMSEIITAHGGWVNKFLGDGILAMFGLAENADYTHQAVKAAMAMQRAMHKYPWGKRIGIATGKYITGEFGTAHSRRFDCLGHIVNLASRLQGHSESGEILVCEETFTQTKEAFDYSEQIKISPKGIGEISVYPLRNIIDKK